MADFTKFRTSLNGFNRSDVTAYIEATSAEHQAQIAELQKQLEQSGLQLAETRGQLSAKEAAEAALQRQLSDANQALDKAKADLDEQTAMSEDLLKQLDETETALKATQDALEEALTEAPPQPVKEEPAEEEPQPAEPQEDRPDYMALELEAYRRAEAMERLSAERTAHLRQELNSLLDQVSSRYEQTGMEIQVLSEDIRNNLQRLTEAMSDLDVIFDETSAHFEEMDADNLDDNCEE